MRLIPTTVTVESEFKTFSLTAGASQGGKVGVTFTVEGEATTVAELHKEILMEKRRLDKMCLASERMRGAITQEEYDRRLHSLKEGYAPLVLED